MFQFLTKNSVGYSRIMRFVSRFPSVGKGVVLALISTALFTIVGVLVRSLSSDYNTFQILFFRQLIFTLLLVPGIVNNLDVIMKPNKVSLHVLRIFGAFIALYFGFVTVSNIPFADATALGFLQVLFVALLARFFLGEQISKVRLVTIVVGFVGVMIVVRPTFEDSQGVYVLTGLFAALGAGIAVICVRQVAQSEPKITLMAYQALAVGIISMVPAIYMWRTPSFEDLLLLLLVGVISSLAQYVGITAYKWAQANIVANVEYVKIIYSIIIGFVVFAEVPDTWSIVGAVVIVSSAVIPLVWSYSQKVSKEYLKC